jgi:hypothetical protein
LRLLEIKTLTVEVARLSLLRLARGDTHRGSALCARRHNSGNICRYVSLGFGHSFGPEKLKRMLAPVGVSPPAGIFLSAGWFLETGFGYGLRAREAPEIANDR